MSNKKSGGKRTGAGRKKSAPTKNKTIRIPENLFNELKSVQNLTQKTIKFWQSLTVVSDCS